MEDVIARLTREATKHEKAAEQAAQDVQSHNAMAKSLRKAVEELMKTREMVVGANTSSTRRSLRSPEETRELIVTSLRNAGAEGVMASEITTAESSTVRNYLATFEKEGLVVQKGARRKSNHPGRAGKVYVWTGNGDA